MEVFARRYPFAALGLTLLITSGCERGESKTRATASAVRSAASSQPVTLDPEAALGQEALGRWAARMKSIQNLLEGAQQLKPGCDMLGGPASLESIDSPLLEAIRRSPNGAVPQGGAAGFPSLQSKAIRILFHGAHADNGSSKKQLSAAAVELETAKFLAVFVLADIARPKILSRDAYAGGSVKGTMVVFDLARDAALCRIPLEVKSPSKTEATKRYGDVTFDDMDLEQRVLGWTMMDLRRRAEASLTKLEQQVVLAPGAQS
jgi:hypothetical protein